MSPILCLSKITATEYIMPINAVEKLHYQDMVLEIANKILITSIDSFNWTVKALKRIVLRGKKNSNKKPIPPDIALRAEELRKLIEDKEMYAKPEDFPEYINIVTETVQSRINLLLLMSKPEREQLINTDTQRLAEAKKPKPLVVQGQNPHVSVISEEEVAVYNQWRLNLMHPMDDHAGLNQDEMANLANLIDNEKYPWAYAMLLTTNIPLAHWIASPDINILIYNEILNIDEYPLILSEPTAKEMRYLSLLSPLLVNSIITVDEVLELSLELDDEEALRDPALRERLQTLPIQSADYDLLAEMGIFAEGNDEDDVEEEEEDEEEDTDPVYDTEDNDDVVFTWTRSSRPK